MDASVLLHRLLFDNKPGFNRLFWFPPTTLAAAFVADKTGDIFAPGRLNPWDATSILVSLALTSLKSQRMLSHTLGSRMRKFFAMALYMIKPLPVSEGQNSTGLYEALAALLLHHLGGLMTLSNTNANDAELLSVAAHECIMLDIFVQKLLRCSGNFSGRILASSPALLSLQVNGSCGSGNCGTMR